MKRKILNIWGLVSALIGVVILFMFAPPQPSFEAGGTAFGVPASASEKSEVLILRHKYEFRSRLGLAFIGVGFLLQFAAEILTLVEKDERRPSDPGLGSLRR